MKLTVILLILLTCACSTHRTRVDCEGRLKPINSPAPVSNSYGTSTSEAPR